MSNRKFSAVIAVIIISFYCFPINFQFVEAQNNTWYVPEDYPTIDLAVIAASEGDTIIVSEGEYSGFIIDKPLTISGKYQYECIVNGAIIFETSNAKIQNLFINKSEDQSEIIVKGQENWINNNVILSNIRFSEGNNTLKNNRLIDADLRLDGDGDLIISNTFEKSFLQIYGKDHEFIDNTFLSDGYSKIQFEDYSNSILFHENEIKHYFQYPDENDICIYMMNWADEIVFSNNYIETNGIAIWADGSATTCLNNTLLGVKTGLSVGIVINNSFKSGAQLIGNTIKNFSTGISISDGAHNVTAYYNNFIENEIQATDDGDNNSWNDEDKGNYWSDWISPDSDRDGIVDRPYVILGDGRHSDKFPSAIMLSYQEFRESDEPESPTESDEPTSPEEYEPKGNEEPSLPFNLSAELLLIIIGVVVVFVILTVILYRLEKKENYIKI